MKATQGQNLSRRLIALSVTFVYLLQYVVAQMLSLAAVWIDAPAKAIASADVMRAGAEDMSGAFMLVLGFYFAAPYMGNIAKAVTSKFTRQVENK